MPSATSTAPDVFVPIVMSSPDMVRSPPTTKSPSNLVLPASTNNAYASLNVWLVPAEGALSIYNVAAAVVVTDELLAANVGPSNRSAIIS